MLNPFANRKVLKRGERAQARIVEMTAPEHGADPSNVEMTLEVSFRGVPYQVRDRWMVSGTEPISAGSEIWVAVDPTKHHRVAIDWERTRADYRERTDVRRRVLAGGVPVPMTKVRDALEAAGEIRVRQEAETAPEPTEIPPEPGLPPPPPVPPEPASKPEPGPTRVSHFASAKATTTDSLHHAEPVSIHERELLGGLDPGVVHVPPVHPPVPAPPEPADAPARPAAAASDEDDVTSRLERLAALHAAGSLSDGEFKAAKAHVLSP